MSEQVMVKKDPAGYPDFTRPVSIIGYTIESLPIDIVAQTLGVVKIDIVAQTLSQLNVNIAAQAVTINVATAVGEHVDTDIISSVQIDVNIAASAITLNVDIVAQSLPQLNINIAASAITLNVQTAVGEHVDADIISSVTIGVDIVAQTVGNIAIDIAAQSLTNVAVNIAAQAVDLNIRTSGGANIVIDKLTQTAYTERRVTLSNNGVTPTWGSVTGNVRRGKFFPRGARGFITGIELYCRDAGTAGGTITVYLAPYIGAGYIRSATITVPAGGAPAWRSATFNVMWNYDPLFIFFVASSTAIQWGGDSGTPHDAYGSPDAGASWTAIAWRFWARAVVYALSVGDLPVSGTLNTISVPNLATGASSGVRSVAAGATVTLLTIDGSGKNIALWLWSTHDEPRFIVELDGKRIRFILYDYIDAHDANYFGFAGDTPLIQLIKFTDLGECLMQVNVPFEWTRKCVIYGHNPTTATRNMRADFNYLRVA